MSTMFDNDRVTKLAALDRAADAARRYLQTSVIDPIFGEGEYVTGEYGRYVHWKRTGTPEEVESLASVWRRRFEAADVYHGLVTVSTSSTRDAYEHHVTAFVGVGELPKLAALLACHCGAELEGGAECEQCAAPESYREMVEARR